MNSLQTSSASSVAVSDGPRHLAEHTTARVGGPAGDWIVAETEDQALEVLAAHPLPDDETRAAGEDSLLVLGGGSNLLVGDAGFGGTVLQLAFEGIAEETDGASSDDAGSRLVRIAAGHRWDDVVAWTVRHRLAGLEALSGIPGAAGATPVQNVGAYGAEIAQTLVDLRAWDREAGELVTLDAEALAFGYRESVLKRTTLHGSPRYVVLSLRLRLAHDGEDTLSAPIRYAELARTLGLDPALEEERRRAPLDQVREQVLALRAGKGMVLDADDHDTWSTGSFFTNPIVPADMAAGLPEEAPRFPLDDWRVKLSAAWLIDHAGCGRGFGAELTDGRASLSTKHTLAITNRGPAGTGDLLAVAAAVREKVHARFGLDLHPEPVIIGAAVAAPGSR